jgi:hypothetical protein
VAILQQQNKTNYQKKIRTQRRPQTQLDRGGEAVISSQEIQRALDDPQSTHPETIFYLQRMVGNGAVQHLLQHKVMAGSAHDRSDQEADRLGRQGLRIPSESLHCMPKAANAMMQAKLLTASIIPPGQQQVAHELRQVVQQPDAITHQAKVIQRLPTEGTFIAQAGPGSKKIGKSTYDKILNGLREWPSVNTNPQKLAILTKLDSAIDTWFLKRTTQARDELWDAEKKQHLPQLQREVKLALDQLNIAGPTLDPALAGAFTSKAQTIQYVRDNLGTFLATKTTYSQISPNESLDKVMGEYFETELNRDHSAVNYRALITTFNEKSLQQQLEATFKRLFGQPAYDGLLVQLRQNKGFSPLIIGIVQGNAAPLNLPRLETQLFALIRLHPNDGQTLENDYNAVVPGLGLGGIPNTLGEIVNDYFVRYFQTRGNAPQYFEKLQRDYPPFAYRIKPAYRQVFGERQLQTVLGQIEQNAIVSAVPNAMDPNNVAANLAFKTHAPFSVNNFRPSTGSGNGFDAVYNPTTGVLDITIKIFYEFEDLTLNSGEALVPTGGKVGASFGRLTWSLLEKNEWKRQFKATTVDRWNQNPPTIQCIRPGWGNVTARPTFQLQEVPAKGNQHQVISVTKGAFISDHQGREKLKSTGVSGSGADSEGDPALLLQQWDVKDKINDPDVHQYLHQAERRGNIEPAYRLDRKRQGMVLNQAGRMAFQPGSGTNLVDPSRLQVLIGELEGLEIPSTLAHLHPLLIEANIASGGRFAGGIVAARGNHIRAALQVAGLRNPIRWVLGSENFDGVVVKPDAEDPTIVNTYVANWSRFTAAHEFGHAIGLVDEYKKAESNKTVQKMIEEGYLPPNTRGDHLKEEGSDAAGQIASMLLMEKSGVSAPDWSLNTQGSDRPMTTSVMTGGFEVTKQHYITAYEVLTHMTRTDLDEKFWKIQ